MGFFYMADVNSELVSERPRTSVSVGSLHPGFQCWHAAASACVPPTVMPFRVSGPTLRPIRPSGVLSCCPACPDAWNSPGFYPVIRNSTNSTDCFRRLVKTYILVRATKASKISLNVEAIKSQYCDLLHGLSLWMYYRHHFLPARE